MAKEPTLAAILSELQNLRLENKSEFDKINASNKVVRDKIEKICKKVNDHEVRLENVEGKIEDINRKLVEDGKQFDRIDNVSEKVDNVTFENGLFHQQIKDKLAENEVEILGLKMQIDSMEIDKRRNNIVLNGIPENPGEDKNRLAAKVFDITKGLLGIEGRILPYQVYRRGENRRIIVKLDDQHIKNNIMKNAYKLKGTNIFISHDYTVRQETTRYYLRQFIRTKDEGKAKFSSQFTVDFEGNTYYYNEQKRQVEIKN